MLKFDYTVTALQPIFTGSDTSSGTKRNLRREKVLFKEPIVIRSNFRDEDTKRQALTFLLHQIWLNIDKKELSQSRLMNIWNEFASKILANLGAKNKERFINEVCKAWGIQSLNNPALLQVLDLFNDAEFFDMLRDELQVLLLRMRKYTDQKKQAYKDKEADYFKGEDIEINTLFDFEDIESLKSEDIEYTIYSAFVPYISGNGVRGVLRRLLMRDFVSQVGITKLTKEMYHRLYTGGNLIGDTGELDLDYRVGFLKACPPIELLGAATMGQIVQGDLKVGALRPICKEHNNGDLSFQELLGETFGTRLDSSKNEDDIEIDKTLDEKAQMKYEYEVFNIGSKFAGTFAVITSKDLIISCFWRMIELWKANNYVGGLSGRDCGMIDINIDIPSGASHLYLNYLKENSITIKEYFGNE